MIIVAYTGSDNIERLKFTEDGVDADFSAVTRITVGAVRNYRILSVIDSDTAPADVFAQGAEIHVRFGAFALPPGNYDIVIKVFDSTNTRGVVVSGLSELSKIVAEIK